MTWKPDSREWHETVNLTSTISSSINQPDSTSLMRRFKASSGATYGEMEFPETAPLVFPELDRLANATGEEAVRKRDKLKKAGAFMTDYYDRRAQAEYVSLFHSLRVLYILHLARLFPPCAILTTILCRVARIQVACWLKVRKRNSALDTPIQTTLQAAARWSRSSRAAM